MKAVLGSFLALEMASGLLDGGWSPRALRSQLLLQRAVQTHIVFLTYFHDEAKAAWLAKYKEPGVTLLAERMSDKDCRPIYNGLDAYCDQFSSEDFLKSMMLDEPFTYNVRYRVGQPDQPGLAAGGPVADQASAALSMWNDNSCQRAAESRRRNPYLKNTQRYIEYEEMVIPARIAESIMTTREQLAAEWSRDLMAIPTIDIADNLHKGDDAVDAAFERAVGSSYEEDSSPLRGNSLDLCLRLLTREAAVATMGDVSIAEGEWLRTKLEPEPPKLTPLSDSEIVVPGGSDDGDADMFAELASKICSLTHTDALGDHTRRPGIGCHWLADLETHDNFVTRDGRVLPGAIAAKIRAKRDALAEEWAATVVEEVAEEHTLSKRTALEVQLQQHEDGDAAEAD